MKRFIPDYMTERRGGYGACRWRTRYLLPLELCLAFQLISVAVSGSIGGGALHHLVARNESNTTWGVVMGFIGIAWLAAASIEWIFGKDWQGGVVAVSIWLRKWLSLAAVVAWSYVTYTMLRAPEGAMIVQVFLVAPVMTLFSVWAWWVNARTETLLDPRLNTDALEKSLESRHLRW